MPEFIPVFPLEIVAFPGENINLHIFEPRYRELILDCQAEGKNFGIPSFYDERIADYGTEVELLSIEKTYDDGKMDIRTRGLRVFRMLEFLKEVPQKLYSGAIVNFQDNIMNTNVDVSSSLFGYIRQVQQLLNIDKLKIEKPSEIRSFELAHLLGLNIKQENELLSFPTEVERQGYLITHLREIIPIILQAEESRKRAQLNGHFRKEIPPNLD
jgi:Lon protease-like protein